MAERKQSLYARATAERIAKQKPSSIGYYDLEKAVGEGNFAKVKLATHCLTGEKVAVKIIDKEKLDSATAKKLFREVRIMKMLNHPHIVRLYEVIDTPNELYLIMEYAAGSLVDEDSRKKQPAPPSLPPPNAPLPSIGSRQQVKASEPPGLNTLNEDENQPPTTRKPVTMERPTSTRNRTESSPAGATSAAAKRRATTNGPAPSADALKQEIHSDSQRNQDSLPVPVPRARARTPGTDAQNRPISFAGVPTSQIVPQGQKPAEMHSSAAPKTIIDSVSTTIQTMMPGRKRATTITDSRSRERVAQETKDSDYSIASDDSDSSIGKVKGGSPIKSKPKPRTLRFTFSAGTTSSKDPDTLIEELIRVLKSENIKYEINSYMATCRFEDVEFEIEICKLPRLNLNGLRFKRMSGNSWTYKNLLTTVIEKLQL
ncbi:Map microtubule affinity-regulating kinase [Rhizoclosmatium hyalinum]|nr:Map microtubule affinity-regulating kinase [Rhizoclosmatium hyalinum]